MDLNSDSGSDSGTEQPTPEAESTMTTPGGIKAKLVVGTRLLVRWESGWESGSVGDRVTPAMGGRAVDGVTPTTLYRIDYDDGESRLHDLTTLKIKLETSAAAAERVVSGDDEADTWAQCERCEKWRNLSSGRGLSSGRALPKHWFCELNPNRAFASCQVAEEQWSDGDENQEVEAVREVVGRVVDDDDEVGVEAVWEVAEEEASSQTELDASVHKKPCGRPPKGTDGLPMRWSGPKEAGRWVEKSEKKAKRDDVRGNVRIPPAHLLVPLPARSTEIALKLPCLAWQITRILRWGLAVSFQKQGHDATSVEQMRPMLCSELHALLARVQQVLPAHWQAAGGAALAIATSPAATSEIDEAAALEQPELFAAMVTVRDELAMVRWGQGQHTDLDERTPG